MLASLILVSDICVVGKTLSRTKPFYSAHLAVRNIKMENDNGVIVDLYIPRKCSSSNRIIHAKDHASIQLSIADVDPETGRMTDSQKMYAICGAIRRMGESDDCLVRLAKNDGILPKNF
ncbi:40S ribosomal protein S21 [Melipona bicolor]|uniref:Small ribosomal subunit protein eS21 n=1 Tax=Melipona bicolor TaxID=60889 RepID=A0AA40GAC4_9HYME|nr:40S ribosomal protein S21 [Melipona bicolor]